jgi:hypothetical protein
VRESDFTCFKAFGTSAFQHLYPPVLMSVTYAMLLLLVVFSATPAYAEEPKVFTDSDLVNYNAEPMVDQDTLSRMEDDLQMYKKNKDAELLLEKEKMKKKQAEEAKRAALEKQKQDAAAAAALKQKNSNKSVSGYRVSPVRRA